MRLLERRPSMRFEGGGIQRDVTELTGAMGRTEELLGDNPQDRIDKLPPAEREKILRIIEKLVPVALIIGGAALGVKYGPEIAETLKLSAGLQLGSLDSMTDVEAAIRGGAIGAAAGTAVAWVLEALKLGFSAPKPDTASVG